MIILSRQNPLVKELASLKEKKGRRGRGASSSKGTKWCARPLRAACDVVRVVVREDYAGETFCRPPPCSARRLCRRLRRKDAAGHRRGGRPSRAERAVPAGQLSLLDGLQDPANVGAIIRTAVAAGYEDVYLADCADPFSPKSVRASMSGVFFARIMQGTREEILSAIADVPVIAADMDGEDVFSFPPPEKFCLAVGSEGSGLSEPSGAGRTSPCASRWTRARRASTRRSRRAS